VRAAWAWNVPAAHGVQTCARSVAPKVPSGQGWQTCAPLEYQPRTQGSHEGAPWPGSHAWAPSAVSATRRYTRRLMAMEMERPRFIGSDGARDRLAKRHALAEIA
jgi:hypothetical protein